MKLPKDPAGNSIVPDLPDTDEPTECEIERMEELEENRADYEVQKSLDRDAGI